MRGLMVIAVVTWLAACQPAPPIADAEMQRAQSGLRWLGPGDDDGFTRVTSPRAFVFPRDHGAHPEYRTEWWYFTGNLRSRDDRHFGFQLTFFRFGLAPAADQARGSAWTANHLWMAHFAITDTAEGRFFARERLARQALGIAGTAKDSSRVWLKDWSASNAGAGDAVVWKLVAGDQGLGLDLDLTSDGLVIANGQDGLDRKGPEEGNASYYYSIPGLKATGGVTIDGREFAVSGSAWLDREWGTSALSPAVAGWDWFSLELGEQGSLMFYRLRTTAGAATEFSAGMLVSKSGAQTRLGVDDVELLATEHWTSDMTGSRYPVAWRLRVPGAGIALQIQPYVLGQEVLLSARYWEGAVHARGTGPAGALEGEGYVELTGY